MQPALAVAVKSPAPGLRRWSVVDLVAGTALWAPAAAGGATAWRRRRCSGQPASTVVMAKVQDLAVAAAAHGVGAERLGDLAADLGAQSGGDPAR